MSQTPEIMPNVTQYKQDKLIRDKITNAREHQRVRGFKAKLFKGKGSIYTEEALTERLRDSTLSRTTGFEFIPNEKTSINA